MLHMGHQRVHGGLPYEMQIQVQACHAARVADRPELVVRQVAAVGTHGPGIGMGCHDRPPGDMYQIPKSGIRQVGHIGIDGVFL